MTIRATQCDVIFVIYMSYFHSTGTTLDDRRFWMTVFFSTIETDRMTKATAPIVTRTIPPAVSKKPLALAADGTGPK